LAQQAENYILSSQTRNCHPPTVAPTHRNQTTALIQLQNTLEEETTARDNLESQNGSGCGSHGDRDLENRQTQFTRLTSEIVRAAETEAISLLEMHNIASPIDIPLADRFCQEELECCKDVVDIWRWFRNTYEPMEEKYPNGSWRKPFLVNHKGKKSNGGPKLLSTRMPVHRVITGLMATGMSESQALAEARIIEQRAKKKRNGMPVMKDLTRVFQEAGREEALQVYKGRGRPSGFGNTVPKINVDYLLHQHQAGEFNQSNEDKDLLEITNNS
jgi:hypothetical protein